MELVGVRWLRLRLSARTVAYRLRHFQVRVHLKKHGERVSHQNTVAYREKQIKTLLIPFREEYLNTNLNTLAYVANFGQPKVDRLPTCAVTGRLRLLQIRVHLRP